MKKSVLLLGLYLLLAFQAAFAADKPDRSTLKATVSANRTTISELEANNVELLFSLTNTGKEPIELYPAASRLFVNGKEVKGWILTPQSGFAGGTGSAFSTGNSDKLVLAPGQTQHFSGLPVDYFYKAGTYKVVWKSAAFQPPSLKIRILRDRVKPAGQEPKHFALIRAIRAILPAGWQAFSDPNFDSEGVKIIRLEPTRIAPSAQINGSNNHGPDSIFPFEFSLRLEPFLAPGDYSQTKINNEMIRQKLIALTEQMKDVPNHKGQYLPETPEHKKQFKEYQELSNTRRHLPEYYFRNLSLSFDTWQWQSDKNQYRRVQDKAVRAECREVTQRVINLLSSYEPQKPLAGDEIYEN